MLDGDFNEKLTAFGTIKILQSNIIGTSINSKNYYESSSFKSFISTSIKFNRIGAEIGLNQNFLWKSVDNPTSIGSE